MTGNERWGLLFADLYASDEGELQRLVRYAEDPDALSPPERRAVEGRLASDPAWRDRLLVLQRFDPALVDGAIEDVGGPEALAADGDPAIETLLRRRALRTPLWVAAAAAAGLVLWFTAGQIAGPGETRRPQAVADRPVPEPPAPLGAHSEAASEAAQIETAADVPAVPAVKETPRHEEVAARAPEAVDADANPDVDVDVDGDDEGELAVAPPAVRRESVERAVVPPPEPIELAMLDPIHYVPPMDRAVRALPHAMLRGEGSSVSLEAWVPDHVARTASAQPVLFWSLAGELPAGRVAGFALTSETDPEPLYEGPLALPATPGRQSIDLSTLAVHLKEGEVYRWTVFVRAPTADPSQDTIAQGWIEYRAAPASLAQQTRGGTLAQRAAAFAQGGYWYDALASLVALEDAHPGEAKPREMLERFLAEAGID